MSDSKNNELQRGIGTRQLSMIAIGGAIGTGLWFASGSAISSSGPGGAMLAFGMMGLVVFFMMSNLGEMATQLPLAGSFEAYASRFIDPGAGFAFGWNYWFSWAITLAYEFSAAGLICKFWWPDLPVTYVAMAAFVLLMTLNLLTTKAYAEAEYWFAGVKVIAIIIFLVIGVGMILGFVGNHEIGFQNWVLDGGEAGKAPFVGGVVAILSVFMVAGFSFQGTEIVGIAAAETKDPVRNVPKAIRSVFWRILLFYIGSIFVAGTLIPFTSPDILGGGVDNVAASPMVVIFENAGFTWAASVLNAVILTSVLSCGNSGLYTGSRMLQSMATRGNAPKIFAKLNKRGVPVAAVWATGLIATLSFLSSLVGEQKIFWMLLNASAISGFVIWWGISICHLRFRKAWIAQGHSVDEFKFKSRFYPWGNWFALVVISVVIFGCNMWVFDPFSLFDFVTSYILIPVIPSVYFIYKYVKKTKIVPLGECDFTPPANLVDDMPDEATLAR